MQTIPRPNSTFFCLRTLLTDLGALAAGGEGATRRRYHRLPSIALESNFLESINVVLDEFVLHHIDRDVLHLGHEIVVVSAGSAVFDVPSGLAVITENRMWVRGELRRDHSPLPIRVQQPGRSIRVSFI